MEHNQFAMKFHKFQTATLITFYKERVLPFDFHPDLPLLFRHILYRKSLGMDTVIVVCGAKRTGKTYFSMKSCEELSKIDGKEFSVEKNVFFDVLPFIKFMKDATDSYCVLEEAGIQYNAQQWFDVQAKIFRNILQSQGFRKNVIFLTLPNISYLLKSARFLCNFGVETVQIGAVRVNKIIIRHLLGKGWMNYIETIRFNLPSEVVIKDYEKLKKEWNDKQIDKDMELIGEIEMPVEEKIEKDWY